MKKAVISLFCVLSVVIVFFAVSPSDMWQNFNYKSLGTGMHVMVYNADLQGLDSKPMVDFAMKTELPTNNNQLSNGSGYISIVPAQTWVSITGKPTLFSGSYVDLTNKPTLFSGSYTDLTNKPTIDNYTDTRARSAISLTNTGTTGASTYNATTGVLNVPNYTYTPFTPVYATLAKTLNATGAILSTTRPVKVSYSVTHTIALTLVTLNGSSNVYLEISPNNSTWTTISQAGYSDGVAVGVAITKTQTNNVQGEVPANYYMRLRSVVSGGGSAVYANGQEVTF